MPIEADILLTVTAYSLDPWPGPSTSNTAGGSLDPRPAANSRVVHAAAKEGLDAIDGPYLDLSDSEGLKRYCEQARNLGFTGKGSINPKQVPIINDTFSPNDEEVKKAERILSIFEDANTGLVMVDGKLIEKPVLRQMQRTVEISNKLKSSQ